MLPLTRTCELHCTPALPAAQNCNSAGLNVQGVGVAYLSSTGCGLFYRFSWWICW